MPTFSNIGWYVSRCVRGRHLSMMFLAALLATFTSCREPQELAYIADAPRDTALPVDNSFAATIHPGDQLYIYVSSQTPESAIPFNQETHAFVAEATKVVNGARDAAGQQQALDQNTLRVTSSGVAGYLVDEQGFIIFPVLGKVAAAGLTPDSLGSALQHLLVVQGYITDPIVTVQLMNFRVAVIGEVVVPREIHTDGNRLTLFEALAMCGDLTVYGERSKVDILREENGEYRLGRVDLTSRALFDSPYYYLQQNDIIYVQPNQKRKRQSVKDAAYAQEMSAYISIGGSVLRTAWMTYYYYQMGQRYNK